MRHPVDRTEQANPAPSTPRRKLTALGRTTALALLSIGLVYVFEFLSFWLRGGVKVLPVLVLALVVFLMAGLVAARIRWAPAFGALIVLVTSTITLAEPLATSALLHPALNLERFVVLVVVLVCALLALVAGVTATRQNYRGGTWQTLGWMRSALAALAGVVVGMIVVALIVAANPSGPSASATTSDKPTVHIAGSNFLTNVVLVSKGERLPLVDDDSVEHLIQNGTWTPNGTAQPRREPGAPVVHNLELKGGSIAIGPFSTAGVFHLYCTIHPGMNLTVVVQ